MNDPYASAAPQDPYASAPAADPYASAQPAAPAPAQPTPAPVDTSRPALSFEHFKSKYATELDAAADRVGIDRKMLRAVHFVEDASEDPNVISSAGAIGEMQFEPGTFKQFAKPGQSITDPVANIDAGALALSHYMKKYGGNMERVLAAYNAGEGAADKGFAVPDYVARYKAIYAALSKDDTGPGHQTAMTKGGAPRATRVAQTPAPPAQPVAAGFGAPGEIKPRPGGILGMIEEAGNKVEQSLHGAQANWSEATDTSDPHLMAARAKLADFPLIKGVGSGTHLANAVVMAPFVAGDVVLRDIAIGNTESIGDVGQHFWAMARNPMHMGDLLDDLVEKYGPGTRAEDMWWTQPGMREAIARAQPATPQGLALQAVFGLNAQMHQYLLNKPLASGALGSVLAFMAPVGGEMALARGTMKMTGKVAGWAAKPLGKAAVAASARVAPNATRAAVLSASLKGAAAKKSLDAVLEKAYHGFVLSGAPITGDRYHAVTRQFGEIGQQAQRQYVSHQAETRYSAQALLGQEDKLGGTSRRGRGNVPGRVDIHREQDKFFNNLTTLHVHQPQGGDPYFDPNIQATTMNLGPAWNKPARAGKPADPQVSARHVVYAEHPAPNMPGEKRDTLYPGSPSVKAGQAERTFMGVKVQDPQTGELTWKRDPNRELAFNKHVDMGLIASAMQMIPNPMSAAEAAAFQKYVEGEALKAGPLPGVNKKWNRQQKFIVRDLVERRALRDWAVSQGHDAIEYVPPPASGEPTQVIIPRQITALKRDDRLIGLTSVHDRAINTAHAFKAGQDAVAAVAPSMKGKMIDGYAPRAKMFDTEPSLLDRLGGLGKKLTPQGGGGQPNPSPITAQRQYGSIQHALDRDEKINPNFDPAEAGETGLARMLRFTEYMKYIYGEAGKVTGAGVKGGYIDYDKVVADAIKSGRYAPRKTPGALGSGAKGRAKFDDWMRAEAVDEIANGPKKLTDNQAAHVSPEKKSAAIEKEIAQRMPRIQAQFEADHPNLVWDAAKELGVEDLAGLTVPHVIRDAAIDGHPVLNQTGVVPNWHAQDVPESMFGDAWESFNNMLRAVYMANPLYHPFWNLSRLAFGRGYLNPFEIAQALLAPHTIAPALAEEARTEGAWMKHYMPGAAGVRTRAKYSYADPVRGVTVDKDLRAVTTPRSSLGTHSPSDLHNRLNIAINGFRNVAADSKGLGVPMHLLGKAVYNADKWNIDWTFNVWEDALATLTYRKLRDRALAGGMKADEARAAAANHTRKILGDVGNITPIERKLGLERMNWFYGWTKGQYRLWSQVLTDPRAAQFFTAATYGPRMANEQTPVAQPQAHDKDIPWGFEGDNPLYIRVGGGFLDKAAAITDLASAPFNAGHGLEDFRDTVIRGDVNTLAPYLHNIFRAAQTVMGQPDEPSYDGTLYDKRLPLGMQAQQMMGQMTDISPDSGAISKAARERDPIYLLGLLGMPARSVADTNKAAQLRKQERQLTEGRGRFPGLDKALRQTPDYTGKDVIRDQFGKQLKDLEDQRADLLR